MKIKISQFVYLLYMYSLQQKECLTTLDKKRSVFLTVNIYENLHASTYTIYEYMYKVKKTAAARARPPAAALCGRSKWHLRAL